VSLSAANSDTELQATACDTRVETPVRVLFAIDSFFPGLGGAEIQALNLAKALREKGVEVEFVAPYLNPELPLTANIEGFTLTRIEYPKIKILGSIVLAAKFAHYLYRNQDKYDSVHIHITRILAAGAGMIRPWISCSVIAKISGFFEFEGGILDESKRFNPANAVIRHALKNIDYIQTISVQTREKLEAAGFRPEQIKYVPNGVIVEENPPAETNQNAVAESDHFAIGYCGRMRAVKGVQILLDGFALLLQANPDENLQLRIAGDGAMEPELREQAQRLGLGDRIEFLGYTKDTNKFLSTLNVYVQPSFAEGLPNAVIEAMNNELPVVATDIGGNCDLVEPHKSGLLFTPGDSNGLYEHLQWCLDNRSSLPGMGQKGRQKIAEGFGFPRVTEKLISLYRPDK